MKTKPMMNDQPGFVRFGDARMALFDIEAGFWSIRRQVESLVGFKLTNSVLQQAGSNGGASFAQSLGSPTDVSEQQQLFESCLFAYQTAGFGEFEILSMEWPIGHVTIRANEAFEAWAEKQHTRKSGHPACAYTAGVLVGFVNVISNRSDVVCVERHCSAMGDEFCEFDLLPATEADAQTVVAFTPNPELGRQLNILEMLFERMPMGIAIFDREYNIQRFNASWGDLSNRYAPPSGARLVPGVNYFDHLPGSEATAMPLFSRVFAGETVRQNATKFESGGIVSYWDMVLAPLIEDGEVKGILNVTVDVTERIQAEEQLKETLARLSESESMLRSVIENAQHFVIYRVKVDPDSPFQGKVVVVSPFIQELLDVDDPYDYSTWFSKLHPDDYDRVVEANRCSMEERVPYNQPARIFNEKEKRWRWVQTISNPGFDAKWNLTHFDGMIIDLTDQKDAELALQELNATLEQRVEDRTHELERKREIAESLADILEVLNSTRSPKEIFDFITQHSAELLRADACLLYSLSDDKIQQESAYHLPSGLKIIPVDDVISAKYKQVFQISQPVAVEASSDYFRDVLEKAELTEAQRRWHMGLAQEFYSYLTTPLTINNTVFGGLIFYFREKHGFMDEDVSLSLTLASHAALAIENSSLRQKTLDRQKELQILLDVADAAKQSLKLDEMLSSVLEILAALVKASRTGIMLLNNSTGKLEIRMLRPETPVAPENMEKMIQACQIVVETGEPLYVAPNPSLDLFEPGALLPLRSKGQILGVLGIIGSPGSAFRKEQLSLFKTIADQLGIAVDNARLFSETQQRRRVAEGLQDILGVINKASSHQETLKFIIQKALALTGADAGVIYRYHIEENRLSIEAGEKLPQEFLALETVPTYSGGAFDAMFDSKPYVLNEIQTHLAFALQTEQARLWDEKLKLWLTIIKNNYNAYLGIPLIIQEKVYGSLGLYFCEDHSFTSEEIDLAVSFGDQTALSIENAQLSEQVRQIAVQSERNRLARDLHDAVSQTLFSASLIAEVLPKLWESRPEMGRKKLAELRQLTRGALSEMRTLLFELRPDTLKDVDLVDLYQHLVNAFSARTGISLSFDQIGHSKAMPVEVKEAFYRIAQEALNNVMKHAQATQASIHLEMLEDWAEVRIADNGQGFDIVDRSSASLGLKIMNERAASVNAELTIASTAENGTVVKLHWERVQEEK